MAKFNSKTFNPEAFGAYIERIPKLNKNELIRSRALRGNSEIRNAFSNQTGTAYAILPMYGLLDGEPLNYDGETDIMADTTTSYERGVVVVGRAKAWVESDFAEDITAGGGFMDSVAQQVSEYFDDVDQDTLLAILTGIYNMTGEENLNLLAYLKQTDRNGIQRDLTLATWNGRAVLIDDSMPVSEGKDGKSVYTTYILGEGAFDYEDIGAKVPYEMDRNPMVKGGQDTLYVRQRKCFAPFGISYTKKNQKTLSPTNKELADGQNWELVNDGSEEPKYINHKAIPIARIISKGRA